MNRDIKTYLQKIEQNLFTCPKKKRVAFLCDFRGSLNAYMEEHPKASVQELQGIFGSPEEIAEAFLQSERFDTSKNVFSSKKRITRFVFIAVFTLVAAAWIYGAIHIVDTYRYTHGYWEELPAHEGEATPDPDAIATY